jgi:hypothetical protein
MNLWYIVNFVNIFFGLNSRKMRIISILTYLYSYNLYFKYNQIIFISIFIVALDLNYFLTLILAILQFDCWHIIGIISQLWTCVFFIDLTCKLFLDSNQFCSLFRCIIFTRYPYGLIQKSAYTCASWCHFRHRFLLYILRELLYIR